MKKSTRVMLWISLVSVVICVPIIVLINIARTGNWVGILYLIWAVVIVIVIFWLLGSSQKEG